MRTRLLLALLVLGLFVLFYIYGSGQFGKIQEIERPPVVEYFACGDYCPGEPGQYIKMVYEGIRDEGECKKIGGTPYTFYGVVPNTICLVE